MEKKQAELLTGATLNAGDDAGVLSLRRKSENTTTGRFPERAKASATRWAAPCFSAVMPMMLQAPTTTEVTRVP